MRGALSRALDPIEDCVMHVDRHRPVADQAPVVDELTEYDQEHLSTYVRLLDADADGADWREVAMIVLGIDPEREPGRARAAWESHLVRARWMTERGYRHLLRGLLISGA
jgi:hypothetical protein